jgi:2-phosphosulfolactate phosphatase
MKAAVFFTLQEVDGAGLQDQTAVVIDVLRASSTIVAALAAGAQAIYPVVSTEEAIKLATSLGREDALLAGERRGLKVEGFDLGNSPREFTPEAVGGKRVVMSTTNGTRALVAVSGAERVLVASFLNLAAVAAACADSERLAVVCAGREGRFSIDDAVCAGMLLSRLKESLGDALEVDDAGRAALALAESLVPDEELLADAAAGRALAEIDMLDDVSWCVRVDVEELVPELKERIIKRADGGRA